tara:strand:+ start:1022 stop:1549 length:528 start_codon:yes stop_codon:yes gene_type:complete
VNTKRLVAKTFGKSPSDILTFWFEECRPWQWFRQDSQFDHCIREQFGQLAKAAQAEDLIAWESNQHSALALVLLLDQFSRQIWRNQARAYSGDQHAQRLSQQAIDQHWLESEPQRARRQFWLMPLLHAECLETVETSIPLLERWVDDATADVARRNRRMLLNHGRYPWRDRALGR